MPSAGLLTGIGQGLQNAVDSYQKERAYQMDLAQKQQEMAIKKNLMQRQNLEEDVVPDASGNLSRGENRQAQYGLMGSQIGYQRGMLNPESAESQQSNKFSQGLMKASGLNTEIPENMPAYGVQQNPLVKQAMGVQGIKMRNDAMMNRMSMNLPYKDAAMEQKASQAYSHEMGPSENQIQASNKILDVLHKAQSGQLVPSQVLSSEIAGSLNAMFTGKPSTVSGMDEAEYKSMEGNLNKLVGYASGDPKAVVTPGQLDQYEKEVKALQAEYLNQHGKRFSSFIKRQPEMVRPKLHESFNDFRRSYPGESAAQGPGADQQAIEWAKSNPKDPRSAAILKANGM